MGLAVLFEASTVLTIIVVAWLVAEGAAWERTGLQEVTGLLVCDAEVKWPIRITVQGSGEESSTSTT